MPVPLRQKANIAKAKTSSSVLDRIQPLGFDPDEGIKVLLYGQSGSGKTTFWGTFPGKILAIVCSGGMRPGELRSLNTEENRKRISQIVLRDLGEAAEVIKYADGNFDAVVLDHVSGLYDLAMKGVLGLDELPAQKSWGLATQQQYGTATQQCKEVCRSLLNLPQNVVIIGQERTFGGKDEGMDPDIVKPTVGVSVPPSMASWLNPACDYVLQMFKRGRSEEVTRKMGGKDVTRMERVPGVEYCARCEVHEVFMTKFRVPAGRTVPDVIVNPTYDKLMAIINGDD